LPGRVFFECFNPDNPVAQDAARQDYEAFYRAEIHNRKEADYPPFCRLIRLLIRSEDADRADAGIESLAARLAALLPGDDSVRMLGPAPAPMERLNHQFRRHIILKTRRMSAVRPLVLRAIQSTALDRRVHLEVDFDPADLL
jgi:primosomal protein N' (replication factor Y)